MGTNKKPGALSYTGLLVVDYVIEISNLNLVKDMAAVVNFEEVIFHTKPTPPDS